MTLSNTIKRKILFSTKKYSKMYVIFLIPDWIICVPFKNLIFRYSVEESKNKYNAPQIYEINAPICQIEIFLFLNDINSVIGDWYDFREEKNYSYNGTV